MGLFLPHGRCGRSNGPAPPLKGAGGITNRIAIIFAFVIIVALVLDAFLNGWAASTFLARKFLNLIDWVTFWR